MDYAQETTFAHTDWKQINDPKLKIYAFQEQSEGEYSDNQLIFKILQEIRCNYANKLQNLNYLRSYFDRINKFEGNVTIKGKYYSVCIEYNAELKNIQIPREIKTEKGNFKVNSWYSNKKLYAIEYKYKYSLTGLNIYTSQNELFNYLTPTNEQLKKEFETDYKINISDGINSKEFSQLKEMASCTSKFLSVEERFSIIKKLSEDSITEVKENLILDLLTTCPEQDKEAFLEKLSNNFSVFVNLYHKMDNKTLLYGNENNKTRFIETLYTFWKGSKYENPKSFTYTAQNPINIDYIDKSKFVRGFTIPEFSFEIDSKSKKIRIMKNAYDMDNVFRSPEYTYTYDFLQPITLLNIKDNNQAYILKEPVPAFYLMGYDQIKESDGQLKALNLIVDVGLLATGTGEVAMLKNLRGGYKIVKGIVLGVELSSSSLDILLNYSNICTEGAFCEKLRKYNFWVQMTSLSGSIAIQKMADKSAQELAESYARNSPNLPKDISEEIAKISGKNVDIPTKYQISIPHNSFEIVAKDNTLPSYIVKSFMDSFYYTIVTKQELKVFRRFGGNDTNKAKLLGSYASTEALLSRKDLALLRKWNTMQFEAEILVEKGTKLNVGKVEKYSKYSGGADQVLLPMNYPESWIKKIRDLKTNKEYTFEEFKKIFPNQIKR
ncbi:hypothetical protein CAPN004_11470 [Capnocytophaga cynodegmi]|nr:hypothetical protein [Capnocytophaga cynodegmi]GIM52117.1 hypothetical protein CAPN004_11470 [Capnocytophaga cynodegmi]